MKKSEAAAYRQELLAAGVGLELENRKGREGSEDELRRLVRSSRGNPAREIHGVPVEDVILCGVFSDGKKTLLVLPPSKEAFVAVIDFLRFEAMGMSPAAAQKITTIANEVELLGRRIGTLEPLEFKSGTTNIAFSRPSSKRGLTRSVTKSGFKALTIGPWAIHKKPEDSNEYPIVSDKAVPVQAAYPTTPHEEGYRVTHATLGHAALSGMTMKAAKALASKLAESPYPWRLLRSPDELKSDRWDDASRFAKNEILKAHRKTTKTKKNPGSRQLSLIAP